jgi:hypothetical protein
VHVRYIDGIINDRIGGGSGSVCSYSTPCLPYNAKISAPYSIAIDASGSQYITTKVGGSLPGFYLSEDDVSGGGEQYYDLGTTAYNYYSTSSAIGADAYGNLYYTYEDPGGALLSPTPLCYILAQNRAYSLGTTSERFWTVAGSGPCGFSGDGGLATGAEISKSIGQFGFDPAGNFYFADTGNNRIRRVDVLNGVIRTVAGNGANGFGGDQGPSTSAAIQAPAGIGVDPTGRVYATGITDSTLRADVRAFGDTGLISFGVLAVGTKSSAQTVLVSNVGNNTLDFAHFGLTSGNTTDFVVDPNTTSCLVGLPLYTGRSCTVGVIFTPSAPGSRAARLTILDDTAAGSSIVELVGGGATTATLAPSSIFFPSTVIGKQSAAIAAKLTNTGASTLTISGTPLIGGTNASSFKATSGCGGTLAAGASCTISVVFAPASGGSLSGTLTVKDNAANSQQTINLFGTGTVTAAKAVLSPNEQVFAAQAVGTASEIRTVEISNAGGEALGLGSISLGGKNPGDFSILKDCGGRLAGGAACTIHVMFRPMAEGSRMAVLSVATSAGEVSVALSGTGAGMGARPEVGFRGGE